jgi:hypothetical protein
VGKRYRLPEENLKLGKQIEEKLKAEIRNSPTPLVSFSQFQFFNFQLS